MAKQDPFHLIASLLLIILCAAALLIWPLGLIGVKQEADSLEYGMIQSGPITEQTPLSGILQAPSDRLDSIGIRFTIPNRRENPGILHFELSDAQGIVLYTEDVPLREMKSNEYYHFKIPQKLQAGQPYIFQLTSSGTKENPPVSWLGSPQTACTGQAAVYYDGAQLTNNALMMQFIFHDDASFLQSLPYELTLIALAVLILMARKGAKLHA